jgi:mono/diheme cytochrome c family protein
LAKTLVAIALFLSIAVSVLIIKSARTRPGVSPAAAVATGKDGSSPLEKSPAAPAAVAMASPVDGQHIFLRDCAHCHGQRGDGISLNMRTLHPAPFDLTSFELADSFIQRIVRDGLSGTDMPGWSLGSDEEVRAVSAYTARLGKPDTLSPQEGYAPPEALQEAGRRIYTMHCVSCHGEQGRGDGPDSEKHLPKPASFAEMRPSYAAARRVIENGVRGTDMPSWPLLTAPEIQAVTFYVRSLYTGSSVESGVPQ